jgi:hypothetical protein
MSAIVIFALLIALMLTGMPISISLGLTVLTFLFTMTQVPLESVALKHHRDREVRDHGDPFFILAGNFSRTAASLRMIASTRRRHCTAGGAGRRRGVRTVRRGIGLFAGDRRRDRIDPAAGNG